MSGNREPVPSGPDWQAQDQIINYSGCGLPSDSNNFTLTVMNRLLLPLVIALLGLLPSLGTGKQLPLPGKSFQVQGQTAFLILPGQNQKQKSPIPWVWYAPTLPNLPGKEERWMFKLWLDRGIAIAGIDVGESYGSPAGRKLYNSLHETLVADHGLAPRLGRTGWAGVDAEVLLRERRELVLEPGVHEGRGLGVHRRREVSRWSSGGFSGGIFRAVLD